MHVRRKRDAATATRHFAIYAHGEVAECPEVYDRLEERTKERAIEEGRIVVAARRADTAGPAGRRIEGAPAVQVVNRRYV